MLERDVDEPRCLGREPQLLQRAAAAEATRGAEREMSFLVVHRVVSVGMRVVVLRQKHRGAEKNRMAPPLRENLALNLDAFDERGVRGNLEGRNHLVGDQLDWGRRRRIDPYLRRLAEQVPRRPLPVLPFPLIHVHPDRVAVRARKARVDVHERLHPVVAGRDVAQARERMPAVIAADDRRDARSELLDVFREEWRARRPRLVDRRPLIVAADRHVHHARDGIRVRAGAEADVELRPGGVVRANVRRRGDGARHQPGPHDWSCSGNSHDPGVS